MDEDARLSAVLHSQLRGLAVLHLKVVRCGVKLEAICRFNLHGIVVSIYQREEHSAILIGSYSIHQGIITSLADLEGGIRDALAGVSRIDLDDLHAANGVIVKIQALGIVGIDHYGLGSGSFVDGVAGDGFHLRHNQRTGDTVDDDLAILIGVVKAVAGNLTALIGDKLAGSSGDLEDNAFQRGLLIGTQLVNDQCASLLVPEGQGLCIIGVHHHSLGSAVQHITRKRLGFLHDVGVRLQTSDGDLTVLVGVVDTVAGDLALCIGDKLTAGSGDGEFNALQRFVAAGILLHNDKAALGGVLDDYRLGIAIGSNHHIGGRLVDDIACGSLQLRDDISTGSQIGQADLALTIGGEDAVLGQSGSSNDTIQTDFTASSSGDTEFCARQRLVGNAVALLDNQLTLGLVLEGQRNGAAFLDLNGLRLGIDDESIRSLSLGDHNALAGFQSLNADLTIFIGAVNTVGIANQLTVRIGDLKFRILEGNARIDRANLPHQQDSVRGVFKTNGDNTLLTAVRQIDGFRGLEDAVAICGVDFLQNVGAGLQASPDSSTVLTGHFLADDGTTGTGSATQITKDEGCTGQSLLGDAVVLLNDNGIEGFVLECQSLALAAVENDLLRGRLLHLETGSRLHFGCGVLTGIEALALIMDKDLTVGIGIQITKVNGGGCFGRFAVAGISHMELCALHRSASHAVLLIDGQLRHLVVLEYQFLFIACIQTDGLDSVRIVIGQIIRCGNGLLGNLIGARCDTLGNRAVLTGSPICLIIVVDTLHSEDSTGNHGIGASGLNLLDGQQRLFQVFEDELLICARAEIDGLGRLLTDHIRNGNSFFSDLIAVHRDAGQFGNALGIGGNILMEAIMDALYLEGGVSNRLFGLFVQLQNLEVRQLLVGCGNGNRTASIHRLLIHMGDDGVQESCIASRSGYLHEGIQTLGHIGNGDLAGAVSCLGTDDLTVLNDIEYCTGLGVITLVLLDQLDLYLCVILESQGDFLLAIPVKLLLDLVGIIADGIALGSSHFRCGVAADGHSAPRHTSQRTASTSSVSASEVVVHTLNLDDCASQTTGGIIGIHLADAAACGDDRGVGESHRYGLTAIAG